MAAINGTTATTTLLPPLTSIFTPPPNCIVGADSPGWGASVATDGTVYAGYTLGQLSQCEPGTRYAYGPAVCPASWTPAYSLVESDITTVNCCVTGTATAVSAPACTATITAPVVFYSSFATTGAPGGSFTVSSGVLVHSGNIYVHWSSGDLASFTPASAPLLMQYGSAFDVEATTPASTTTPMTTTPAQTTITITPTHSNTGGAGLSTGAQAGIGVGVGVVGLAALVGLGVWLYKRRGGNASSHDGPHVELQTSDHRNVQPEMVSNPRY